MPREVASLLAGSMVTTTVLLPNSAARRASAPLEVVLPTPPDPQSIRTRLDRIRSSIVSFLTLVPTFGSFLRSAYRGSLVRNPGHRR